MIDVLKFQINEFPKIKIEVKNRQAAPLVKQSWMGDLTFEKFGIEEEDL